MNGEIQFSEFVKMVVKKPCEKDTDEDIRKVFNTIDWDMKGIITVNDLKLLAQSMNDKDVSIEDLEKMVRVCDPYGKG